MATNAKSVNKRERDGKTEITPKNHIATVDCLGVRDAKCPYVNMYCVSYVKCE